MASPVILAATFHMVVVRKNWLKFMSFPLDHNKTFRGKRIFGDNKTYRGLFVMIVLSIFFAWIYYLLYQSGNLKGLNLYRFREYSFIFYGFLLGLAYVLGELPNSFVKRQIDIQPGTSQSLFSIIVDQMDSVVTVLLALLIFSDFTWTHFGIGLIFFGLFHLGMNFLLYSIGLRKNPF